MQTEKHLPHTACEQGSRRRYRRLFAEGEGNSAVTTSGGCFPDFYSTQDFSNWLAGNFQGAHPVPAFAHSLPQASYARHAFLCCCSPPILAAAAVTVTHTP